MVYRAVGLQRHRAGIASALRHFPRRGPAVRSRHGFSGPVVSCTYHMYVIESSISYKSQAKKGTKHGCESSARS